MEAPGAESLRCANSPDIVTSVETNVPRRHCVLVSGLDGAECRLGIWRVFDPWVDPRLLVLQGHNFPPLTRPLRIEFHFRRVVRRLIRSLGRLYQSVREWDRFLEEGGLASPHPELAFEIPEEAGIAADSVFHYLNLFVDDLARIIPFVYATEESKPKEPDGFSKLKKMLVRGDFPAPQAVKDLFAELDREASWWSLGFKPAVGMRQRLTHYTDLVYFSGKTKQGDTKITGDVSLITIGGPIRVADFEKELEMLLTNFCEWLDRLDTEILTHLSASLARKGISWIPFAEPCPALVLPKPDEARLDASHYLYLPVCSQP